MPRPTILNQQTVKGPRVSQDTFRAVSAKETIGKEYLRGWLEKGTAKASPNAPAPWSQQGRAFSTYYETLNLVLRWYKLHKISVFRPMGWCCDEETVGRIHAKLAELCQSAVADSTSTGEHDEFFRTYDPAILAQYTALDHLIQNATNRRPKTILDFGSGIGRQAMTWVSPETIFYSVDAIESLYILQNEIYSRLFPKARLREYFEDNGVLLDPPRPGDIVHLPTWHLFLTRALTSTSPFRSFRR